MLRFVFYTIVGIMSKLSFMRDWTMKEKELKRLSRADLLEMLIDQSKELQEVREKLQQAEAELKKREIAISNAGSIAEASLMLNGVFEAAQAACRE